MLLGLVLASLLVVARAEEMPSAELSAARVVGRETVDYVGNIYKYYVAYKLARDKQARKAASG